MMMNRISVAAFLSLAVVLPVEAQWTVVGEEGRMHLSVDCQDGNQVVVLALPCSSDIGTGMFETIWDGGRTERYNLREQDGRLYGSSSSPEVMGLITKLRQNQMVRVQVQADPEDVVTDRIDLTGSSRAIDSLPCSMSDAEIRRIIIRQSIARYSGSCACPYNTDRGGRRCGGRSAYSRPGGASPLCYDRDVSDAAVAAYRRRNN